MDCQPQAERSAIDSENSNRNSAIGESSEEICCLFVGINLPIGNYSRALMRALVAASVNMKRNMNRV